MKKIIVVVSFLISAAGFAQATAPASTTTTATVPNAVISLMAGPTFQIALKQAKDSLKNKNSEGLIADNISVIGYSFTSSGKWVFGPATVILGAPQSIWPTCVYRIGTVTGDARQFPDGINGVMVGNVKFNPETPTRSEGCDK